MDDQAGKPERTVVDPRAGSVGASIKRIERSLGTDRETHRDNETRYECFGLGFERWSSGHGYEGIHYKEAFI
jgi:hypothetical protein